MLLYKVVQPFLRLLARVIHPKYRVSRSYHMHRYWIHWWDGKVWRLQDHSYSRFEDAVRVLHGTLHPKRIPSGRVPFVIDGTSEYMPRGEKHPDYRVIIEYIF